MKLTRYIDGMRVAGVLVGVDAWVKTFVAKKAQSVITCEKGTVGEFIRASVRTCAFAWFQTHCDIFLNLLAGKSSSQTAWLMLCCPISVNQ